MVFKQFGLDEKSMKVLVTGAEGMLGHDLCPTLEDNGYEVIETNHANLDILDQTAIERTFKNIKPDIVIHTAAYTDVNKAETEKDLAYKINVTGTENITKACKKYGAVIVYISSDYIYDGNKKSPYTIEDKPNPINVYGKTKLEGENIVKTICTDYYIIRTSLLYGLNGKNFVDAILAQKNKPKIKVVNDQISCPTWTYDLSDGIIEVIENMDFGTYNICGKGEVSRYDLAKFILSDYSGELVSITTDELDNNIKRPKYSSLEPSIKTRKWQAALKDYLLLKD